MSDGHTPDPAVEARLQKIETVFQNSATIGVTDVPWLLNLARTALAGQASNRAAIAREFYDEVCRVAEQKMLDTGKLEGSHYAAMQVVLGRWGSGPLVVQAPAWTTDKPTVDGLYWYRDKFGPATIVEVQVERDEVWLHGVSRARHLTALAGSWSGPLAAPGEGGQVEP
jgi:hypothetical protein